jgi:eukaryotic-like serine/threonine-protein kinase
MKILKWVPQRTAASAPSAQAVGGWRRWAPLAAGVVAVALAVAVWRVATKAVPVSIQHFAIPVPDGYVITTTLGPQVGISPDGAMVAFSAISTSAANFAGPRTATGGVFIKHVTEQEPRLLSGAERGMSPFFSPDGAWIGFVRDAQLHKVSTRGGAVVRLAAAGGLSGASWGTGGTIPYSPEHGGAVWSVPADGGEATQQTFPDRAKGERGHHQPVFLPGAKAFLFTIEMAGRSHDDAQIAVQEIGKRDHRTLITGGMSARYVAPGFLVYARAGQLMAMEFDLNRLAINGSPRPVLSGVRTNPDSGAGEYDIAANGALTYVPGSSAEFRSRLRWVDREGKAEPLPLAEADYINPQMSKSETMVAVTVGGADADVWLIDLTRNVRQRATFGQENLAPLWFPSGDRLVMKSNPDGAPHLYSMPITAGGSRERLVEGRFPIASSFSPDGSVLLYEDDPAKTGLDMFAMTLADGRQRPLIQTPFDESSGAFSPDGHWIAYVSNETGRIEVSLIDYPGLTRKIPVSRNGGAEPVWAKNGQELFYREGDALVAVPITKGTTPSIGQPRVLFRGVFLRGAFGMPSYDVASDGKRFLAVGGEALAHTATRVNYVLGWTSQLKN